MPLTLIAVLSLCSAVQAQTGPSEAPPPSVDLPSEAAPQARPAFRDSYLAVHFGNSGMTLLQGRERYEFGLIDDEAVSLFARVPAAHQLAQAAAIRQRVGLGIAIGGMVVEVAGLAAIPLAFNGTLSIVVIIAGVALGATIGLLGVFYMYGAIDKLHAAVARYNAELLNETLPPDDRIDLDQLEEATARSTGVVLARF